MGKYVASRKDVCAGLLLKPENVTFELYDDCDRRISEDDLTKMGISNFSVFSGLMCRGMLISVDENGLSNDLIYTTPTNYPIEGVKPKIDVQTEFVISEYTELNELLKYLNYGVDLTQDDLNQIYRKLITHNWWLNHHDGLFGYKGGNNIPMSVYYNLRSISFCKKGKPYKEEPGYSRIKRRK